MKFLVVVLATVAAAHAVPEADPAVLYSGLNPYLYPSSYLASPYNFGYNYAPYNVAPYNIAPVAAPAVVPAPIVKAVAPAVVPAPIVKAVAPAVVPVGYGPRDCVTVGGCNVRALKDAGLAKRDAESDPQLLLNAAPLATPFTGALPLPYAAGLNPFLYANAAVPAVLPQTLLPAPAPVAVDIPQQVVVNAPAPIVKTVAPVAPVAPVVKAVPAPVVAVRAPIATPVVAQRTKKVTYTHLGAHPISPTDVLETETEVVGHTFV